MRIPKRETSSDFTAAVGASTDAFGRICVFVIFVMVRFSIVTSQSPNVLPRTENQKGDELRKREKNRRRYKGLLLSQGTTRGDETPEHPRA